MSYPSTACMQVSGWLAVPQVCAKPKAASDQIQHMVDWISANYPNHESGIVYCLTRKDTEQVASELSQLGLACGCYHADMDPSHRQSVHMQWSTGTSTSPHLLHLPVYEFT